MSERMCWSTDPFLRDVRITDADELADEMGLA